MTRYRWLTLTLGPMSLLAAGCSEHSMGGMDMGGMDMGGMDMDVPPLRNIGSWSGSFDTPAAENVATEPASVEIDLEAKEADVEIADGRTVRMWTYNGSVPGPRIEANVGDRVRVRFKNSLPDTTTIHWHGLRLPAEMDGAGAAAIDPGDEFVYEFMAVDAGTFWYHPHVDSDEQVERGLYGPIVIHGAHEPTVTSEHSVVLDDVLLDEAGQLAPFDPRHAMLGRQGNVLLANGHAQPALRVASEGLHRLHFINAANARYFRLALGGRSFKVIGFDSSKLEAPRDVTELLLVPGARADVLVSADANQPTAWQTLSYDRGHATGSQEDATLFVMDEIGPAAPFIAPPVEFAAIEPLADAVVSRTLVLGESMGSMSGGHMDGSHMDGSGEMSMSFSINGKTFPDGELFEAKLGDVEEWTIRNDTTMDHPFHLHGFRFQIAADGAGAPPFLAYYDTVNVPAQQTLTIRVPLEANPGMWMFHCHILEHAERGMMGTLKVSPD